MGIGGIGGGHHGGMLGVGEGKCPWHGLRFLRELSDLSDLSHPNFIFTSISFSYFPITSFYSFRASCSRFSLISFYGFMIFRFELLTWLLFDISPSPPLSPTSRSLPDSNYTLLADCRTEASIRMQRCVEDYEDSSDMFFRRINYFGRASKDMCCRIYRIRRCLRKSLYELSGCRDIVDAMVSARLNMAICDGYIETDCSLSFRFLVSTTILARKTNRAHLFSAFNRLPADLGHHSDRDLLHPVHRLSGGRHRLPVKKASNDHLNSRPIVLELKPVRLFAPPAIAGPALFSLSSFF